jgi:hypothetical protein
MFMKKITLFLILTFSAPKLFSQTVLLQTEPGQDTITPTFGQNLKHFTHLVLGFSVVFGETGKEFPVINGISNEFHAGIRTKRKITPVYSFGYDFFYRSVSYYVEQNDEKKFPDTVKHKSQKFNFFSLGLGVYNRFNLDPHRGNFLGTYIDAGITGEWDFTARTVTRDVLQNDEKVRVVAKNFDYVNSCSSRVFIRGGRSRVVVYGAYRITDHFKAPEEIPDPPRFIAGVELNIF